MEEDSRIEAALSGIGHKQDLYRWARDGGMYCTREQLRSWLASSAPLVIVDSRDEDVVGGMIRSAIHLPDGAFGAASVKAILAASRERSARSASSQPVRVVFHCMESVRRGPRCAKRLACALDALPEASPAITLHVLEGGFDQWVRRHWNDPQLVEGYDDDYYGFAVDLGSEASPAGESAPAHPLYHRPADQPATPWSAAGEAAMSHTGSTDRLPLNAHGWGRHLRPPSPPPDEDAVAATEQYTAARWAGNHGSLT
eukprot:CAMPEP_0119061100 /NCGR_PEP_ID=MMETSP1178-20130426/4942_1 /TAXON_ID=33656 /ORGANISM="unid sp, Strain CCMP2000" /LENGTH=255 /DNA_ID=CAMNT_0007042273 /DNA_START=35 /DNA_END=802 /DNA_ORIENTATION=-